MLLHLIGYKSVSMDDETNIAIDGRADLYFTEDVHKQYDALGSGEHGFAHPSQHFTGETYFPGEEFDFPAEDQRRR